MSASPSTDDGPDPDPEHFDRFDNADAARSHVEEWEDRQRSERQEAVQLYGKAAELFSSRYTDTFEVERHGVEIEFYRPVGATDTDLSSIEADDPELAARLQAGSEYLERFDQAQRKALEKIGQVQQSGEGLDGDGFGELVDEAMEGTELMRKALSAFAVDESFHDPRVWTRIFPDDDHVTEVFEEFRAEGNEQRKEERAEMLQNILSGNDSTS